MRAVNIRNFVTVIGCAWALGFASQATAIPLTIAGLGSQYFVGRMTPDLPANEDNEVLGINTLRTMLVNTTVTDSSGDVIVRSGNTFAQLPEADTNLGFVKDDGQNGNFKGPSASLNVDGFEYVLGKYADSGALVFYVGGLSGIYELPATFDGHDLSHTSLFNALEVPGPSGGGIGAVPDGGTTAALLGFGLLALSACRRFIKS
jgi:hypothetical protein